MKKVSRRELARTVSRQLLEGVDPQKLMKELAGYLIDHKMQGQAGMVLDDIALEIESKTGHTTANVRTSFALGAQNRRKLEEYVKRVTAARSIELTVTEDKSLLGGMVLRTPRYEYDASIRHKLNQLARGEA